MKRALTVDRFRQRILVRPQSQQLIDDDGNIVLDFVGRYEELQQSFDTISERIGLPATDLLRKNASEHATFAKYYDDELIETIGNYYREDLRMFDYEFEPAPPTN